MKLTEEIEHKQIVDYIKMQYPDVVFNTDMSGVKLTKGQARKASKLRSDDKFPDLSIYESKVGYNGLFIELKRTGEKILNKHGEHKNDHIKEQFKTICRLRSQGYYADFCIGFDAAKRLIDWYMNL